MLYVPKAIFFTKGKGIHKDYLQSFELALRDAKIEKYNLVPVSSIYPPSCKKVSIEEGVAYLEPYAGARLEVVIARNTTNERNRLIAASIGVAVPADPTQYGYLSEHHSFGETDEVAGDYAEDLAATMLATTLGVEFDPEIAWDEREKIYKMSGKIIRTFNITQSAEGDKNGLHTTVIAAAVFLPEIPPKKTNSNDLEQIVRKA